jgi:hypothetical protein
VQSTWQVDIFGRCVEYSRKTWELASYRCPETGDSTKHSHITVFSIRFNILLSSVLRSCKWTLLVLQINHMFKGLNI